MYWYASNRSSVKSQARGVEARGRRQDSLAPPFAARRVGAIGTPEAFDLPTTSIINAVDRGAAGCISERIAGSHAGQAEGANAGGLGRGIEEAHFTALPPMPAGWAAAFEKLMKSANGDVRNRYKFSRRAPVRYPRLLPRSTLARGGYGRIVGVRSKFGPIDDAVTGIPSSTRGVHDP